MMVIGRIYISRSLAEKFELSEQATINVRAGVKVLTSKLIIKNSKKFKGYMLSPSLARALCLKRRKPLRIRYDQEQQFVHIGPTIGILTVSLPNHEEFDPKSLQAELIFLSKISMGMAAQIYIFTPGSINWQNHTTKGYHYRQISAKRGIWISSVYPLPDVVYNRIPTRASENTKRVKNTRRQLKSLPYLKYFNNTFLNKWKVYQILSANVKLLQYLPETKQLSTANLKEMLKSYDTLYLKPGNGSLGRGIIKVRQRDNGKLEYNIYKNGRKNGKADNPEELMKKTRNSREKKAYIVQEGIDLTTYRGAPFDIRIIYQKDRNGEWKISKKFVRVAPRGSSIANLSRGGKAETSKKIFSIIFNKNKEIINAKNEEIKELCETIALTMEGVENQTYGELGLDLGIDKTGKLWIIEVNSKPRKTTETDFSMGIVRNTFKRPLEYSIHLAGFE